MKKAKLGLELFVSVSLIYLLGEIFLLLLLPNESDSAMQWITIGYFFLIFVVTCLICYWRRNDSFGKRLLLLLIIWLLSWVLDFLMAGIGVASTVQQLFSIPNPGEFDIAVTVMLKGSVLFSAMISAIIFSNIIIYLYHLRRIEK